MKDNVINSVEKEEILKESVELVSKILKMTMLELNISNYIEAKFKIGDEFYKLRFDRIKDNIHENERTKTE